MEFPLGRVLRVGRFEGLPYVVYEEPRGVTAVSLVNGEWEPVNIAEVKFEGALMPLGEFEKWVNGLKEEEKREHIEIPFGKLVGGVILNAEPVAFMADARLDRVDGF